MMINKDIFANDSYQLKVDGKQYQELPASVGTISQYKHQYRSEYIYTLENNKMEERHISFLAGDKEIPLEFIRPAAIAKERIETMNLKEFQLNLLSLEESNKTIAVEIKSNNKKLNQNKLYLFEPMLIDEAGKEYSVDPLSESRNELKCYGKTDGKIMGIKSSRIYYEINADENEFSDGNHFNISRFNYYLFVFKKSI